MVSYHFPHPSDASSTRDTLSDQFSDAQSEPIHATPPEFLAQMSHQEAGLPTPNTPTEATNSVATAFAMITE
jgi:hypothetical protein